MELHVTIIIFFMVMMSSDAEEAKLDLSGTVGGNITLPDPLLEKGFLLYGGKTFAQVNEGNLSVLEGTYTGRLDWNRNTGLFTLAGLQRNDSGIYAVDSQTGKSSSTSYELTVYDPVPTPHVKRLNIISDSCSLLCSVDKETTLLWYKDEEILNQSSSALSLSLSVYKQDFSSSYKCVAANPAETKTQPVDVKTSCEENDTGSSGGNDKTHYLIQFGIYIFGIILVLSLMLAALMIERKHLHQNKRTNGQTVLQTMSCGLHLPSPQRLS